MIDEDDGDLGGASVREELREWLWAHPTWWCVALSLGAWALVLARGAHARSLAGELLHWALMIVAMMVPLTLRSLANAASRSLWSRRHRAMALFLVGYLAPWMVAAAPVELLRALLGARGEASAAAAVAFGVAAAWLLVPLRDSALGACHRTIPLAPTGWRADRDCLRYGATIGIPCVVTCLPLMAACAFAGHATFAMVGAAAIAALERLSFRTPRRAVLVATLALAAVYAARTLST